MRSAGFDSRSGQERFFLGSVIEIQTHGSWPDTHCGERALGLNWFLVIARVVFIAVGPINKQFFEANK